METIKFGEQYLPIHPFIWCYDRYIPTIDSAKKYDSIDNLKLSENIQKKMSQSMKIINKYTCEFYEVTQEILEQINPFHISYHSWYFSKLTKSVAGIDMTNEKFKVKIFSGLFSDDDSIIPILQDTPQGKSQTIQINTCDLRLVHVHNNRLSPKADNSFVIIFEKIATDNSTNKNKKISFVTIGFCSKLKVACVTLHHLIMP